ncbi:phage tail assembly protein [Kitasatospora sp. NPDC002551]|uniref:phage tail assembly protein n=1 Tax=Kitasatospora sp. NPDC002551 TaxID=3154539 RepID=UPI003324CA6F
MSTLDRIMAKVAKTYLSIPLDLRDGTAANLRNLLLLDEADRRSATAVLAGLNTDTGGLDGDAIEDQLRLSREFLAAVSDRPGAVTAELADWLPAAIITLVEEYMEATQAGEA